MNIRYFTLVICVAFLWVACGNEINSEVKSSDMPTAFVDEHHAENSLDVAGTYTGILPCANCEGLETKIVLNEDNTAITYSKYLGKSDSIYEDKGTWTIKVNTLSIQEKDVTRKYIVGEGWIKQLDGDGNEITGEIAEMFFLRK